MIERGCISVKKIPAFWVINKYPGALAEVLEFSNTSIILFPLIPSYIGKWQLSTLTLDILSSYSKLSVDIIYYIISY